jgi:cobalt/nickel transport system ATP-binding protein
MPTVERDLSFGPRAAGKSAELAAETARASAKRVGLPEGLLSRAPHELSSGERRRAALAAVLTSNPKLLALDEPTNSLDAPGCHVLANTLRGLDCAMLVATHDLAFVRELCTRALVLVRGNLVADEALGSLMADGARLREYGLAAP